MLDIHEIAQITREFLQRPLDRQCFRGFFDVCFHLTRGYLRILESRGHHLPVDEYSGTTPRDDLTFDCLATLFASEPGRPYYPIRDYLKAKIDSQTPAEEIMVLLQGIIRKHARQELFHLTEERDPQAANIRRAVRRAMDAGEYDTITYNGALAWALRATGNRRRRELPPIDDNALHSFVLEACRLHPNMPERCRAVFQMLDKEEHFANCIEKRRLNATLINVLIDQRDYAPQGPPTPETAYLLTTRLRHVATAIEQTIEQTFTALADKRDFSVKERGGYYEALTNLMFDFVCHGDYDPLPHYLKESIPSLDTETYLKKHKYVWETCAADCMARIRKLLGG